MERDTEWTSQEITMLLQRVHKAYVDSVVAGRGAIPRTNSTLFLAFKVVSIDRD